MRNSGRAAYRNIAARDHSHDLKEARHRRAQAGRRSQGEFRLRPRTFTARTRNSTMPRAGASLVSSALFSWPITAHTDGNHPQRTFQSRLLVTSELPIIVLAPGGFSLQADSRGHGYMLMVRLWVAVMG